MYRDDPPSELCQGDIIRGLPHLHLKPPLRALRETTISGNRQAFEFYLVADSQNEPKGGYRFDKGEQVASFCQLGLGMVLSHGCDIDNDKKHRQVALVRPLIDVPPESQQIIRENRNHRYFYLAGVKDMVESYVDFRRITCISPDFIDLNDRIASLDDETVEALQAKLFFYITRREVN